MQNTITYNISVVGDLTRRVQAAPGDEGLKKSLQIASSTLAKQVMDKVGENLASMPEFTQRQVNDTWRIYRNGGQVHKSDARTNFIVVMLFVALDMKSGTAAGHWLITKQELLPINGAMEEPLDTSPQFVKHDGDLGMMFFRSYRLIHLPAEDLPPLREALL